MCVPEKNVELIKELSLLFIAHINRLSLITFLSLYKPVTKTNHYKGVCVYWTHDSQTLALRLKAKTIRFFSIKPLNPIHRLIFSK